MEEYKSNSHKSKEGRTAEPTPEKKVEKVVTGGARTKKRSEIQKFADVFISEDVESVKTFVIRDVLIPAMKKAISDIVVNGIDMLLYGEAGRSRRNGNGGTKVSYQGYYANGNNRRESAAPRNRTGYDYDSILFTTRGDAEAVLVELEELIAQYGVASIMDLYSAAGLQCDYTYDKYGWTNLRNAQVVRARMEDGYYIKLPKALPLD